MAIETAARPAGRLPARHRPPGVRDQPDVGVPAIGTGTRSPAASPTTATPWSWPTSCAPTWPRTGRCPHDSELGQAIAVLARAQQDAVWERTGAHNKLRSLLREYYPAFLAAFAEHPRRASSAPRPAPCWPPRPPPRRGPRSPSAQLRALLRRPAQRGIDAEADRLQQVLRADQLRQPPLVEDAMGRQALALLRQLDAACASADDLAQPPLSLLASTRTPRSSPASPASAALTGARVLAEIGDDRTRFADARGLKAYAGAAPITRASGKTTAVLHRRVKNQRLAAVGYVWAFAALTASPGARAHYDRRKAAGDRHAAAQRNLFNRLLGCLHHCLATGQPYDETTAFPAPPRQHQPRLDT